MKLTPTQVNETDSSYNIEFDNIHEFPMFLGMHAFIYLTNYYDSLGESPTDEDKIKTADKMKEMMNAITSACDFRDTDPLDLKLSERISNTLSEFENIVK